MSDPLASLLSGVTSNQPMQNTFSNTPATVDFSSISNGNRQRSGFGSKVVGKELKGFMMIEVIVAGLG